MKIAVHSLKLICCFLLVSMSGHLIAQSVIELKVSGETDLVNDTAIEVLSTGFVNVSIDVLNSSDEERTLGIRREKIASALEVTDGLCWYGPITGDEACYLAANITPNQIWTAPHFYVFAAGTEGNFIATIVANGAVGVFQYRYFIFDALADENLATVDIIVDTSVSANENLVEDALKISPNPANNFVEISNITDFRNAEISIFNLEGQKVLTEKCVGEKMRISLEGQLTGMYFVHLSSENISVISKLIVK